MGYLFAEVGTIALLAGFTMLTQYEMRHNVRVARTYREAVDRFATRLWFVFSHVDFSAFVCETVRHALEKTAHDSAHLALQVTRLVEQQLTRVVRYFRARFVARQALSAPSPKESSVFARTMVDFKQELRDGRSEDIKSKHTS